VILRFNPNGNSAKILTTKLEKREPIAWKALLLQKKCSPLGTADPTNNLAAHPS